jgi:excisionase family DNA binding protein
MLKETLTEKKVIMRNDCLTTTELAKLCGVSRFTIINWVNQGKIRTMKTVGGHCRIPVSEAISFYENFHKEKIGATSESFCHCWEYPNKSNRDEDCKDCLLYGSRVNYCFIVARQFGRELIRCKGDCLDCDYFEEFFSSFNKDEQLNETHKTQSAKVAKDKKKFLYNAVYRLGWGVQEVKGKVTVIKEVLGARSSRTKQVEKSNA